MFIQQLVNRGVEYKSQVEEVPCAIERLHAECHLVVRHPSFILEGWVVAVFGPLHVAHTLNLFRHF